MKNGINIVLAGVGGQGTLVAGKLLGMMAVKTGMDIKVSEVHGMSQRGGSVVTYVRIGEKVYSPVIEAGMADFVLAFEELEALRYASLLAANGTMIINKQRIIPVTVKTGKGIYPEEILGEFLKASDSNADSNEADRNGKAKILELDAQKLAAESGNIRCVNLIMIGVMAQFTPIPDTIWMECINETFPPKLQEINKTAFLKGKTLKVDI